MVLRRFARLTQQQQGVSPQTLSGLTDSAPLSVSQFVWLPVGAVPVNPPVPVSVIVVTDRLSGFEIVHSVAVHTQGPVHLVQLQPRLGTPPCGRHPC